MIFENTNNQDELYLAFLAGTVTYVLPLSDVGQIVTDIPRDMPAISLSDREENGGVVIFQDEEGLAALKVGRILGLVEIPPSCQYEMPAAARGPGNRWIGGVAFIKSIECLCYLLDRGRLRERFL